MELIFLGTSSGTPTKERNVSGIALKKKNTKKWSLIDCGEGTQHQLLKTNLSLNQLEAIYITHIHGDHCYGLPGLLASAGMNGRTKTLTIVAPLSVLNYIDAIKLTTELFLPYQLEYINAQTINQLSIGAFNISAIQLSHRVLSFAYRFQLDLTRYQLKVKQLKKMGIPTTPYWGEIQKGNDIQIKGIHYAANDYLIIKPLIKTIIIGGDNDNPNLLTKAAKNTDVIVHEATYTHQTLLAIGREPMHCSSKMIATFAESVGLKNLVLTHFSPRYQSKQSAIHPISTIKNEAKSHYRGRLYLANDFDHYWLNKDKVLKQV